MSQNCHFEQHHHELPVTQHQSFNKNFMYCHNRFYMPPFKLYHINQIHWFLAIPKAMLLCMISHGPSCMNGISFVSLRSYHAIK